MPTKDLLLRVTGDSSSAEAALYRAEMAQRKYDLAVRKAHGEMTTDLDAAARRQSAAMDRVGSAFLAVGAAAGIGLGLAAREAIQWESAFASVAKTFPGGTAALADLEEGLRDLALVLPASHEEIAAVAAAAGALGVKAPDILQFTHTMIDLGNATDDLDAQSAAVGLAQFMNVVGTAGPDVERLASTLVELGNNGASTEGQILEMAQRLAAAGKVARLSEADILGMASALTSVGIEAEAGGSAFSKVFIGIDDAVKTGNDTLQTFADVAGMSAARFSAAFRDDAAGATVAFVEGLGKLDAAGVSLTGTLEELGLSDIRVKNALLSAAGASDLMREAVELANAEFATGNALQDEVAKRYATTESKIKLAKNALTDAGIEIGSVLLPVLSSMASSLSEVLGWFSDLPAPVKAGLTAFTGLVAVSGLVVGGAIKIQGAIARMNTQLAATPALASAATVGMKALGAAGIVAGLAAVAYAANKIMDSFDTDKLKGDIGTISAELYRLGVTGEATGEVGRVLGDDLSLLTDRISQLANGELDGGWEGMSDFANDVSKTDQALANLVQGGDMEAVARLLARTGLSAEEVAAAFPTMTAAMADNELRAGELATEQAKLADSTDDLTPAQKELAEQFGLTGTEAKQAAEDLSAYDEALSSIIDQLFGTQQAHDKTAQIWIDLRDKMAEAAEAGIAFDTALRGDTAAAIENRATLVDLIDSYLLQIATWDQASMSSEDYDAALQTLRDDFLANAEANHLAKEAVQDFDDAMALLPPKVTVPVEQPGMVTARLETGYLQAQLDALAGTTYHTIQVDTYYTEPTGYTGWQDLYGGDYSGGRGSGEAYGAGEAGRGYGSQERGGGTGTYSMPGWGGGSGYTVQRGGGAGAMGGGGMTNNINITHVENNPFRHEGAFDISGAARQVGRLGIDGIVAGRVVEAVRV